MNVPNELKLADAHAIDTYLPIITKVINSSIERNERSKWTETGWCSSYWQTKTFLIKKTLGLWAYCHICLRFLKDFSVNKLKHLWVINYQPSYLGFLKTITHNIA